MKRFAVCLAVWAAIICFPVDWVLASQEVKPNNTKTRPLIESDKAWTLNFKYDMVKFIVVKEAGRGRTMYWYMTYMLANQTGSDRFIVPRFELVTDTDKKFDGVVSPEAERGIRFREASPRKLLNDVTVAGVIKPFDPKDAKTVKAGVAIFHSPDPKTDRFSIFVSGLSNGFRKEKVVDPDTKQVSYRYKFKTLRLNFVMPGDEFYPDEKEIRLDPEVDYEWIYR